MNTLKCHVCEDCRYFHQHYVKMPNGSFHKAGSGHCAAVRIRLRMCDARACAQFEQCPPRE